MRTSPGLRRATSQRRLWRLVVVLAGSVVALLAAGTSASAVPSPVPAWSIHAFPAPTNFKPGGDFRAGHPENLDSYQIFFTNSGSATTDHTGPDGEIELTVTLPPGLGVDGAVALEPPEWHSAAGTATQIGEKACVHAPVAGVEVVTCKIADTLLPGAEPAKLVPGQEIGITVPVSVPACPRAADSCGLAGSASVVGGGAAPVSNPIESLESEEEAKAGFHELDVEYDGADGMAVSAAATHPFQFNTAFALNTTLASPASEFPILPSEGDLKEIEVSLPPGFAGNPTATPRCTHQQFNTIEGKTNPNGSNVGVNRCPDDAAVGTIAIQQLDGESGGMVAGFILPIYNLVPPPGMPAQLGFEILGLPVYIDTRLRNTEDYGVTTYLQNTAETRRISAARVTIWGNPGDESHNELRGRCAQVGGSCAPSGPLRPFLRLPSSCGGQLPFTIAFERWLHPGFLSATSFGPELVDCAAAPFTPSIEATPTTRAADSPSGLRFDLHNPQPQEAEVPGEADLKDASVTLPEGFVVDPSSANGLEACSEAAVGFTGMREGRASFSGEPAQCPDASKLGTVMIRTPLVDHPLPGSVYLARQGENPFGSLLGIYITVDDPRTGVVVKLAGHVQPDLQTGRLVTTVERNPQLPFEDFELDFFAGARGPLRTPATCGTFTTGTVLTPWSAPEGATASPSDSFAVTSAPGGGACAGTPAAEPNSPAFEAGTVSPTAGAYSPLVVHLSRNDGSQNISRLNVTLPPGATGKLAGIPQCSEAQIAQAQARNHPGQGALEQSSPSCPASSAIGTVTVGAGAGPDPFYVTGKAYLAGPYGGAPFSVVFVTPAVAGPFDLGAVVVRAGLYVNPNTAQVTTKSDPLPAILDGIPLDVRSINVTIDRSEFILNPTNCTPLTLSGEEVSTLNQTAPLSSRFQVGSCQSLKFAPKFTVSTSGKTSKASGASLSVKVAYPAGSLGSQANIGRVDLQLPKQLPARLSTLQKACTEAQFDANPAGCPAASMIGTAKALTPLLNGPLVGPAILVSHGGAAFPDVEFLLQGEGVLIVLDGRTQIKNGITYSHFETVPDQPISTFEATFPQGPYSVLATNLPVSAKNSLCGQNLTLPTTLTAQNGAVINQNTKASITGCARTKALTRAQKLTIALKTCHKRHGKKRSACERAARKKYGPLKQAKKRQKRPTRR